MDSYLETNRIEIKTDSSRTQIKTGINSDDESMKISKFSNEGIENDTLLNNSIRVDHLINKAKIEED